MILLRTCAVLLGAALLISATTASAGEIPRYDVERYCKAVAQSAGGSDMIYNGCMDGEQMAYNDLKGSWAGIPGKTVRYCNDVARSIGGSYEILKGCIDQETEAAGNKKGFQY